MAQIFNDQKKSRNPNWHLIPFGSLFLIVLVIISSLIALTHFKTGKAARAYGNSFIFTAAGDYAQTAYTTANLKGIARSGAAFNLALGDFSYSSSVTAAQWSSYAKGYLPSNFPFEIIPGDHDAGQLSTYATNLPDYMSSTGTYGQQYYFDYPPGQPPLARFIMISPGEIPGYTYTVGSSSYSWVSSTIDAAHTEGIPWVIVGMYQNCFSLGSVHCSNDALLNLLVSKNVNLILYAHKHTYQASEQLAFNGTTCTSLTTASYNASCVVNTTSTMSKSAGSVIVITGTGGAPLVPISSKDRAFGYFRKWEASNSNPTWGFSEFSVSDTQITMQFVRTGGGNFTDGFTLS